MFIDSHECANLYDIARVGQLEFDIVHEDVVGDSLVERLHCTKEEQVEWLNLRRHPWRDCDDLHTLLVRNERRDVFMLWELDSFKSVQNKVNS